MDLPLAPGADDLVLYHSLLRTEAGAAMAAFLRTLPSGGSPARGAYLELVRTLYRLDPEAGPTDDAWQNHLIHHLLGDENAFTRAASAGRLTPALAEAAAYDLRLLQGLFRLTGETCRQLAAEALRAADGPGAGRDLQPTDLPTWQGWAAPAGFVSPSHAGMAVRLADASDWPSLVDELAAYHRSDGMGVVGRSWFLGWDGEQLQTIAEPALVELDDLAGLVEQKAAVQENTEAFLRGGAGQNLLLYGPRGTGKSSLVRGLALRYGQAGLRLVEVSRDRLGGLAELYRQVRRYPQRFILFLDDLTFETDDADYRAFKSALEGALERRPPNLLLYVTSNRRHMIPERWTDRNSPETAEVHGQDAMEERLSLADRFGRTILFLRPDQEEYLAIVEHLVARRGLPIGWEELRGAARRWVLWQNGISGRSARQFVDELEGRLK